MLPATLVVDLVSAAHPPACCDESVGSASSRPRRYKLATGEREPGRPDMLRQTVEQLTAQSKLRPRYDNFIGGEWKAPVRERYFENVTPITGEVLCAVARSSSEDIELALDAAHAAADRWAGLFGSEPELFMKAGRVAEGSAAPLG